VIATQVARTDRRALSEAWYSALHLAHRPGAAQAAPAPRVFEPSTRGALVSSRACVPGTLEGRPLSSRSRRSLEAARDDRNVRCDSAQPERRLPACPTSLRVERALTTLAARWSGYAAQTIDVAGGRVRLLVRVDRGTTRIIAVCSPPLREPVARALAHARFALASAGHPIGAS
jgi:hypothetical protein